MREHLALDLQLEACSCYRHAVDQQLDGVSARAVATGAMIWAMQLIELPRRRDGSDGEPDEGPDFQLEEMFGRLKASLSGWMQAVDLLRPR